MKTNIPSTLLRCLFAASLGATTLARAGADEGSTATAKLSAPGKPATFRVEVPRADIIHIVGVDGDTVTVTSSLSQKDDKPAKPGALRRLDDEVSFALTEHDNIVTLSVTGDSPWAGHDAEFKISVPRAMALDLKTDLGGDLVVKNTDGDIEVSSMNGDVVLDGISGSAVVNTMNGEVHATYAKAPQKLVSITSMNGEIDLRVPGDTKASISMRTHNGSIMTDFDEAMLKTKSEGGRHAAAYSYAFGGTPDAREAARDAARTAADATRAALQVAREVTREVGREVGRSLKNHAAEAPVAAEVPVPPGMPRAPRAPMPPITGGKLVTGTLNGGGVDIKISTMNGEITLRQAK